MQEQDHISEARMMPIKWNEAGRNIIERNAPVHAAKAALLYLFYVRWRYISVHK